jgi:uncharacterized protein GlcG (DUF336 family)
MSELMPVKHDDLRAALQQVQLTDNGGLGNHMWAAVVNRMGAVVAIAYSGKESGDQWPGSRIIAAQKAATANAMSLPGMALASAHLYSGAQPGGFMYGIASMPPNTDELYAGNPMQYGTAKDHLVGKPVGGVCVFAGGLALYTSDGTLAGGLGLSGDTSCADHNIAWKLRHALELDYVPAGVNPIVVSGKPPDDNIVYDIDPQTGKSASGWGHPQCPGRTTDIAMALPSTHPTRSRGIEVVRGETQSAARERVR